MTIPRWFYWFFAVTSGVIALVSLRALVLPMAVVMPAMAHFLSDAPVSAWAHVTLAPLALALAPFQLAGPLRRRFPTLHRWMGRLYGLAVLGAGGLSLALLPTSVASPLARTGFGVLAVLWIGFTVYGVLLARRGDIAAHRRWMLRSVALTYAAVTLRVVMAPLMAQGWTVAETYDVTAWGSWLFNLAVLEAWQRWPAQRKTAPEGAV